MSPATLKLGWLAALAALSVGAGACSRAAPRTSPRSVLVVVVDSLHAGHVSAHGHARPTTPHFDRLAAGGVRFERAYSQSSWTLPSTASLFTALDQERHGVRTFEDRLPDALPTLAERFRAAGYRTRAVVQSPVLSSRHGLARGFERYQVFDHSLESVRKALALAEQHWFEAGDAPLFLYLHLAPPHMPYQPPAPFAGRFGERSAEVSGSIEDCRRIHRARLAPEHADVQRLAALYDEHVAFADDCVGQFLERLRRARGEPRAAAWVVWTSDHGEAFMQHGSQGHNATVYEEMIHVPLAIAALDGSLAPRVVRGAVSTMDVAPTLLELCGLEPLAARTQGMSLAEAVRSAAPPPERALYFSSRYKADESVIQRAVRRGRFKLLAFGAKGPVELFDLDSDPHERTEIGAEHGEVALELRELLASWRRELAQGARAPEQGAASAASARAKLAELGYLDCYADF